MSAECDIEHEDKDKSVLLGSRLLMVKECIAANDQVNRLISENKMLNQLIDSLKFKLNGHKTHGTNH